MTRISATLRRTWKLHGHEGVACIRAACKGGPRASSTFRCERCGKAFMAEYQRAHHTANAARLCRPGDNNSKGA